MPDSVAVLEELRSSESDNNHIRDRGRKIKENRENFAPGWSIQQPNNENPTSKAVLNTRSYLFKRFCCCLPRALKALNHVSDTIALGQDYSRIGGKLL